MPFKRILIKEFLKEMETTDLKECLKKEVRIKFSDGSEVLLTLDFKKKGLAKLKIIKSG